MKEKSITIGVKKPSPTNLATPTYDQPPLALVNNLSMYKLALSKLTVLPMTGHLYYQASIGPDAELFITYLYYQGIGYKSAGCILFGFWQCLTLFSCD